ncbi:MAG: hypothetical protein HWN66_13360, partial [Candidatus Helarchaeota archaeon]|nr:hypothetical protein [Candidatus Helarchaeota archaeon]
LFRSTTVTYFIYRNGLVIANTTLTNYTDLNLSPGTYNYSIIPIDAAGNIGSASTNQTATVTGGGPPSGPDFILIIILIIVGLAVVSIGTIAIRKRKPKPRAPSRPRPTLAVERPAEPKDVAEIRAKDKLRLEEALKEKSKEAAEKMGLRFFMVEEKTLAEEPEVALEVTEEPTITREVPKKEAKPADEVEKLLPKVVHFTFYCLTCVKWFGLTEYAKVDCPICNKPLKLSYYCPTCNHRFTVKEPGVFVCPRCKSTNLVP